MNWCFAIINKKLAEIYFEENNGKIKFLSHCYVNESDYRSVKEKAWIQKDTIKTQFIYKKGSYKALGIHN